MLEQLLNNGKYPEILEHLANGEKLPTELNQYNKSNIFDRLFREKQYEIINLFIDNKVIETDVYEFDSFDKSIFQSIVRNLQQDEPSIAFFKEFISKCDNLNDEVGTQTLLGYFFEKGAGIESIKVLIDAGCDVHFKNNAEENFIQQITKTNLNRFDLTYEDQHALACSYITLLLNEGVPADAPNIVQETALMTAIKFSKKHFLALLLQNGANPNHTDKTGNTAFFYAVASQFNPEMYHIMRQYETPQFDIINRDQVSLLFEYVRMMSNSESHRQLLQQLIEDGADVYQVNIYYGEEKTALDLVAEKSADVLQIVLESGVIDINRQDNKGNTLLHKVCAYNVNYEAEKAKETYRKVKLLLEIGADVSITNDKDQTALMLASDDNLKIKTVELLIKKTA
ncbi:ankyrin repeat domain-containing protein [Chitinophagaceae bacterium MMS25-I14]